MPNSKQASKRLRQDEVRRQQNKQSRSAMKTAIKKVFNAEDGEKAKEALPRAMKLIDKAAKNHVVHENAAARLKGQVSRSANAK